MRYLRSIQKEDGFTLVELLVVIIIIGILAAIAIPVFLNQRQRANDASVTSDIKNVAGVLEGLHIVGNTAPSAYSITSTDGKRITITAGALSETASLSNGVALTVQPSTEPGSFRLCGWHPNGKDYKDKARVYDSAAGGLQRTPANKSTCASLPEDWPITGPEVSASAPGVPSNVVLQVNPVGSAIQYAVSWDAPADGGAVDQYDVTVKGMNGSTEVARVDSTVPGTQTSTTVTKNWTQPTDKVVAEVVAVNANGSSSEVISPEKGDMVPDRETPTVENVRYGGQYKSDVAGYYDLVEVRVRTSDTSPVAYYIMSGEGYSATGAVVASYPNLNRKNAVRNSTVTLSSTGARFVQNSAVKATITITGYDSQNQRVGSSSHEVVVPPKR